MLRGIEEKQASQTPIFLYVDPFAPISSLAHEKKFFLVKVNLLSVSAHMIAQQLTLIESSLFYAIPFNEFLGQAWAKKVHPRATLSTFSIPL
jgi:hypothetical protein